MQKPTIGRIVHTRYKGDPAPAIITRVHSDQVVNLRVMRDASNETPCVVGVYLHESEETARAIEGTASSQNHAWWPSHG
jgi:hypothetical protein